MASIDRVTTAIIKKAPPADTPHLVASAQKELARLGCYSGDDDGELDAATKVAIKKYRMEKGEPAPTLKSRRISSTSSANKSFAFAARRSLKKRRNRNIVAKKQKKKRGAERKETSRVQGA